MEKRNLIPDESKRKLSKKNNQLWLLLWKNLLLQKRSVYGALIELIVPTIFVIILIPIRTIVNAEQKANFTTYKSFGLNMFDFPLMLTNFSFGYYPNDSLLVSKITKKLATKLNLKSKCEFCFLNFTNLLKFFLNKFAWNESFRVWNGYGKLCVTAKWQILIWSHVREWEPKQFYL